jgi:hypothetical protein
MGGNETYTHTDTQTNVKMEEEINRGMIREEMRHTHTHTNKCKNGRTDIQRNDMGGNETYTHTQTYKQM